MLMLVHNKYYAFTHAEYLCWLTLGDGMVYAACNAAYWCSLLMFVQFVSCHP